MVGRRIRDRKVAGSPPRSMRYHVTTLGKLFTCTCLCPPSSIVGTSFSWDIVHHRSGAGRLAAYRQTLQLVANWRRSGITNTRGCRCIHLRFVGCLNKRIFIIIIIIKNANEYYIQWLKFHCCFFHTLSQRQHWIFGFFLPIRITYVDSGPRFLTLVRLQH